MEVARTNFNVALQQPQKLVFACPLCHQRHVQKTPKDLTEDGAVLMPQCHHGLIKLVPWVVDCGAINSQAA